MKDFFDSKAPGLVISKSSGTGEARRKSWRAGLPPPLFPVLIEDGQDFKSKRVLCVF
jgi:hypothetical protein